jgi:hypothetical protein
MMFQGSCFVVFGALGGLMRCGMPPLRFSIPPCHAFADPPFLLYFLNLGKTNNVLHAQVCQKVEERGVTTYAEVADELVQEFQNEETCAFDEKNIRRRVYDALNVLMAIDIITKDKKRIRWKGFPHSTHKEREGLQRQAEEKRRLLDEKTRLLEEKAVQMIKVRNHFFSSGAARGLAQMMRTQILTRGFCGCCLQISNLVERNSRDGGEEAASEKRRVGIPFVIVKASTDNTIECEIVRVNPPTLSPLLRISLLQSKRMSLYRHCRSVVKHVGRLHFANHCMMNCSHSTTSTISSRWLCWRFPERGQERCATHLFKVI